MDFIDNLIGYNPGEFSLDRPKYDQSTFFGRFMYFFGLAYPTSLFYTKSQANEMRQILDDYKNNSLKRSYTNIKLWKASWVTESTFHPDTKEPIPILFRLSTYTLINLPISIGMLLSKKTTFSITFWQVFNQTNNVGFNYCNRSINDPFTNSQLVASYFLATISSVCVALWMDKQIVKYAGNSLILRTFGPATALAIAGDLNLLAVRYRELYEGISVYDKDSHEIGKSKIAAWDGLTKTLTVRFGLQYPLCFVPVLLALSMKKIGYYPGGGIKKVLTEIFATTVTGYFVAPACMAYYPHMIYKDKLEPELNSNSGFWYNRGI
ncbi:unnamed protein product [Blepharisma stoltei]|uniref:Uncharacterized protein n=1 Tax=Blepharisma stoltei TaxID=1481888 RepID=A0AAU9K8C4_9CILI|nr:unnamed protein product [Blepharisma stoltei]